MVTTIQVHEDLLKELSASRKSSRNRILERFRDLRNLTGSKRRTQFFRRKSIYPEKYGENYKCSSDESSLLLVPLFQPLRKFYQRPIPMRQPVLILFLHFPEGHPSSLEYRVIAKTCISPNIICNFALYLS
jgi:hypothetical protein